MSERVVELLTEPPEAVTRAAEVVAGVDRCLMLGFGRLGGEASQSLDALVRIFADGPLGPALAESMAALGRLEFVDRHFAVLAAARSALQGARYDALRAQVGAALGRPATTMAADGPAVLEGPAAVLCESTRHWLMELALAGFKNLEGSTVSPFSATLDNLRSEPQLARLASVLIGFQRELLHSLPTAAMPVLPLCRWADLWARGMIDTLNPARPASGRRASGRLSPLGIDLRQHGHFASADVYGLFEEPGGAPRVVRTTVSAYKVDAVRGPEVWDCFAAEARPLLRAAVDGVCLECDGMTLLDSGDLVWDGTAKPGPTYEPMELAARWLAPSAATETPGVFPSDRHPVQLAEPVYLDGYTVAGDGEPALGWVERAQLPVTIRRPWPSSEARIDAIDPAECLKNSSALVGLLRFDGGGWHLQPLGLRLTGKKGTDVFVGPPGEAAAKSKKKKGVDTLSILRERAGRLLRKKS